MGRRSGDIGIQYNFDASDHLAPESFMPSQYGAMRSSSHSSPEKKLMFGIFATALRDLHSKKARISYEARLWFEATGDNYVFSFENIAHMLGLSERDRAEILAGRISLRKHRNRVPVRAA